MLSRYERFRNRVALAAVLMLTAGGGLAFAGPDATFATFSAETENANSVFAGGFIPGPTGLSAGVAGASNDQFQLSWTSGASASQPSPNPVVGQQLEVADGGSGASPSCGGYAVEGSTLGPGTTSATDDGGSVPIQDWVCYRMVSLSGTAWTTSGDFAPVERLVPVSVVFGGNGNGKFESGETITITFNQPVAGLSANKGVCQVKGTSNNGFLILGFSGTCASGATYGIGKITGITVGKTGSTAASVNVLGDVVTITATGGGQNVAAGGAFVASTSVTGSGGSPTACTAAACQPTPSGSF